MGTRLYNTVVIVFWMATMSWLLVDKLWPTLRVGDPPNYHNIFRAQQAEPVNAWSIHWNDNLTGWALGKLVQKETQMRELHSRVYIGDLPLDGIVPRWLSGVIQPILYRSGPLDMDLIGQLDIDPLGRVAGFKSSMRLGDIPDVVTVRGTVDGNILHLVAKSGQALIENNLSLANNAVVGDGLSPQGYLPNLYQGQTWTVCNYSLFHASTNPIDVVEARVEGHLPIVWDGESVKTWVVVYRVDTGTRLAVEPMMKAWVREDGLVLQQELVLFGAKLRFTRLNSEQCQEVRDVVDQYVRQQIPVAESKRLLDLIGPSIR